MNAHDLVIDRVLDVLQGTPPLADGNVFEERLRRAGESISEAIVLRFVGSTPQRGEILGAPVDWITTIAIEHHTRDDRRTPAGRASRRLHAEVYARLMADRTLGGVASDIDEPRLRADLEQLDTELGCLIAEYDIAHRTAARSLEVMP